MDHETTIKNIILKNMHRCVVCHREHELQDIEILKRGNDFWTMVVECQDCHSRNFVAASMHLADTPEIVRNITEDAIALSMDQADALPLTNPDVPHAGDPINAGDVVDMHDFLRVFDGDFRALFRSKS